MSGALAAATSWSTCSVSARVTMPPPGRRRRQQAGAQKKTLHPSSQLLSLKDRALVPAGGAGGRAGRPAALPVHTSGGAADHVARHGPVGAGALP